jgi:hypothetical protein
MYGYIIWSLISMHDTITFFLWQGKDEQDIETCILIKSYGDNEIFLFLVIYFRYEIGTLE